MGSGSLSGCLAFLLGRVSTMVSFEEVILTFEQLAISPELDLDRPSLLHPSLAGIVHEDALVRILQWSPQRDEATP